MLKSIAQKQTTLGAYWHEIIFSTLKSVKHHNYPSQLFCLFYTSESHDGFTRDPLEIQPKKFFCVGLTYRADNIEAYKGDQANGK